MNKHLVGFGLILIAFLILNSTLPGQLNSLDGTTHFRNSQFDECPTSYPVGVCFVSGFFAFNEMSFWLSWFFIIALLPILFFVLTKNPEFLTAFFLFTGTFFIFEMYQPYAQVLMSFFFIFMLLEKDWKKRGIVILFLTILTFSNFLIHNQQANLLVMLVLIELVLFAKDKSKYFLAGCIVPQVVTDKVVSNSLSYRSNVYFSGPTIQNLFQWTFFYAYHFFVKNMLFVFSFPALLEIWRAKDLRTGLFFLLILGAALFFWVKSDFQVYTVTRILMWLPIVLLPSFLNWLKRQSTNTRRLFWISGVIWFVLQLSWYFVNKSTMVC